MRQMYHELQQQVLVSRASGGPSAELFGWLREAEISEASCAAGSCL